MTTIGIKELRDTLTRTIRRVEAGDRVEITRDGKPVALIVPVPADPLSRLVAEGRARPAAWPLRPTVPATTWPLDRSSTEIISEGREDRF